MSKLPKLKSFDRVIVAKNGSRCEYERVIYPAQFHRHREHIRHVEQTGVINDADGAISQVLEVWRPTRRCDKKVYGAMERMTSLMLVYQHRESPEGGG